MAFWKPTSFPATFVLQFLQNTQIDFFFSAFIFSSTSARLIIRPPLRSTSRSQSENSFSSGGESDTLAICHLAALLSLPQKQFKYLYVVRFSNLYCFYQGLSHQHFLPTFLSQFSQSIPQWYFQRMVPKAQTACIQDIWICLAITSTSFPKLNHHSHLLESPLEIINGFVVEWNTNEGKVV